MDATIQEARRAVREAPDDVSALVRAANVARRHGERAEAASLAARAVALVRASLPARRRAEFEATGGCPVCLGTGVQASKHRRCPREIGRGCTPALRAVTGTLDVTKVTPADERELASLAALGA